MGALISAIDCHNNCLNCFNQHIKNYPTQEIDVEDIIGEVKNNIFNQGIILAGLEWTLQPDEMYELILYGLNNNLNVMLYTGINEEQFIEKFPNIIDLPILIKFGRYDDLYKSDNYFSCGVKLASTNQYVKQFGK